MLDINMDRDWCDEIDLYRQYFHAHCVFNGVERRAAYVKLSVMKDTKGMMAYRVSATFFPFADPEDFLITTDAMVEEIVEFIGKRRNKKKEAALLEKFRDLVDPLLPKVEPKAEIYWDRPLRDAQYA